eukprot:CAMPEP_0172419692 /NCGR_PEP_ID=MMETSP1064-20121228/6085_1 /TAXON_ID=202472 /ORGANISM="Aulacoseira subarctica , Strain CCAP 1002/5" /LENGTH=346 /DNA_ID=CAMNT_0013159275 /DNA_START=55 /DNA_END=1095 /DNA_ORIENTATION=-
MTSSPTESNKIMSPDDITKAKSEIYDDEDEFEDAVEERPNEADDNGNFEVTAEEISVIRAELACEFPDDYTYLSESYIKSVASKPYSKDLSKRRPLEYSTEKLSQVLQWRQEEGISQLLDLIRLTLGPENSPEALADPEKMVKAKAVATALNTASQYWHGFTKDGKPIFWVRTNRKFWYPDVDAELKALIILTDAGIRSMPQGTTEFVVVSDSTSPPPPNPSYMIGMLKGLVKGYPDRLGLLMSAPVSSIIQFVMKLLLPLMPGRLSSKVLLYDMDRMVSKLEEILPNGKDDIPTFFGGPANHDEFYPEEGYAKYQGKGSLKFDYFGMVERLEAARDEWIASEIKK